MIDRKKISLNNKDSSDNLITETGGSFRDRVSNIDTGGKRIWIYPQKPEGRFHRARLLTGFILIAILVILPFIKYKGQPYFLVDLINRKFILFGSIWFPHDFYIFAIGFLSFAVFIVLFTAIFGRIFCGWACPQLIFMELVFRKIEYFIEGNVQKQKALNKMPMNFNKFIKKFAKQLVFICVAVFINAIVFSYIVSIDGLMQMIFIHPGEHVAGVVALSFVSFSMYLNFSWFREQACTYVCPYGRLQSVLLDKNSIIVAYDYKRGEPRGKIKGDRRQMLVDSRQSTVNSEELRITNYELRKDFTDNGQLITDNEQLKTQNLKFKTKNGDCIDCGACVRVCPTGIDIRNGLQLECVNCTACIDACDKIMDDIKKPRGLIKYSSILNIEKGQKFKITPRLAFYGILLVALLSVFFILVISRTPLEATILRAKGSTFFINENGNVVNIFTVKLINKSFEKMNIHFKTEDYHGKFKYIGTDKLIVKPEDILESTFLLEIPRREIHDSKNKIEIEMFNGNEKLDEIKTVFSGPEND